MSWPIVHTDDLPIQEPRQATVAGSSPLIIWLLIGYMWLFIHRPFEVWPWLGAIHIERVYMILTILWWLVSGPSLPSGNRLHRCFAAFVLVTLVSWFLSPYQAACAEPVEDYLKYVVFYVLLVTSVRNEPDLCNVLAGYVGAMALFLAHCVREYFCGAVWNQQGILRMGSVGRTFDPNDVAGLVVCSLPFVWVLWRQWTGRWKRAALLGYLALAAYSIMLTGSRMGFIGAVLASMLACLASPRRWRLFAIYPVLFAVVWMVLPEDRRDRYFTLADPDSARSVGSDPIGSYRLEGLVNSIPIFLERPVLGLGPMAVRAMKHKMPHNLYGQLLAELGVAGALAFGWMLLAVAQNALEARRVVRSGQWPTASDQWVETDSLPWNTVLAAAATFLLLVIMAWGFNFLFWHVWLWFGGFQVVAMQRLYARHAQLLEIVDA